ncbi:reticulocalbin-2 [Ahaetulla prasina]|uniref:reticulocalbin-2 n=1 Tax=Ahaetulla prasina TaxID=499056 RepID=UPI002649865E|nr:reticulocalbin-2 [Ahaetulla prasina]
MEPPPPLGLLLLLPLLAGLGPGLAEHRADFDREALLGSQDEVEEFSKLSPEEQQKRLKVIINKIDRDLDGFLTEAELSSWIQHSFKDYVIEDAKQQFQHYDKDGDGRVSWEEYNIQMYDRVIDFEEDTTLDDAEEESFRQAERDTLACSSCFLPFFFPKLHLRDKKRFEKANKEGDLVLDFEEFVAFEHPEEADYMKDFVIQEALEEHDKDGDGFVSLEEFLGDYRRDPTAKQDPEWIVVEEDRFKNDYDKDKDGKLNPKELLTWVMPNNEGLAQEEAVHLLDEMDLDGDRRLSASEILENQDLFLNSEATDYGRQLHDKSFYHEEL